MGDRLAFQYFPPAVWTAEMGDEGVSVASKIQAMQRGKQARREVELLKEKKEQEELGEILLICRCFPTYF
jgi:hypothetical protein